VGITRYWSTVRYLKSSQVFFQLWYRLKQQLPKKKYDKYFSHTVIPIRSNLLYLIASQQKYSGNNSFLFLHIKHQFPEVIDWDIQQHGKLWNYNLQYFDYLFDNKLTIDACLPLISDCAAQINSGALALEPYPVSLRLVNWILYCGEKGITDGLIELAIKKQIAYLEDNLEYHIQANHLLENYIALVVSACYLNDAPKLKKYYAKLTAQVDEQVLADGAHYECTPMYHCIILSKLLLILDILSSNKFAFIDTAFLRQKTADMLGWLKAYAFEDGSYAHYNDSTNGVVVSVDAIHAAAKHLSIYASTLQLGTSGYRKLTNAKFQLLADCGKVMPSYQPGHTHSDMLSFCLHANGLPVIVDTGVSTYENNAIRHFERSTAAHNTVHINNENQSDVWSSFRVGKRANISIHTSEKSFLSAKHDGYLSRYGILHQRSFSMSDKSCLITDELIGKKRRFDYAIASLHFFPEIDVNQVDSQTLLINSSLTIRFEGAASMSIGEYAYANGYNLRLSAKCVQVQFTDQLVTSISLN